MLMSVSCFIYKYQKAQIKRSASPTLSSFRYKEIIEKKYFIHNRYNHIWRLSSKYCFEGTEKIQIICTILRFYWEIYWENVAIKTNYLEINIFKAYFLNKFDNFYLYSLRNFLLKICINSKISSWCTYFNKILQKNIVKMQVF